MVRLNMGKDYDHQMCGEEPPRVANSVETVKLRGPNIH